MTRGATLWLALLALLPACSTTSDLPSPSPQRAAVTVTVSPNPVIATGMADGRWEFPFRVRIVEQNGVAVEIDQVRADVLAFGGIRVHQQSLSRAEIQKLGYPVTIEAGGTLELPFRPQRSVPDPSLFNGVTATVTLEGRDINGNRVEASTSVSVRPQM